jgi:hypothetical protein
VGQDGVQRCSHTALIVVDDLTEECLEKLRSHAHILTNTPVSSISEQWRWPSTPGTRQKEPHTRHLAAGG